MRIGEQDDKEFTYSLNFDIQIASLYDDTKVELIAEPDSGDDYFTSGDDTFRYPMLMPKTDKELK